MSGACAENARAMPSSVAAIFRIGLRVVALYTLHGPRQMALSLFGLAHILGKEPV